MQILLNKEQNSRDFVFFYKVFVIGRKNRWSQCKVALQNKKKLFVERFDAEKDASMWRLGWQGQMLMQSRVKSVSKLIMSGFWNESSI